MIYPVYAVRDIHVGFNAPMTDVNDNVAKRNFAYAINNESNGVMNFAPKDYDLYQVGTFDTLNGSLEPLAVPKLICTGTSVFGVDIK